MSKPKHTRKNKTVPVQPSTVAMFVAIVGVMALCLWWATEPKPHAAPTAPVVNQTKEPQNQDKPATHDFHVQAWCDHQPVWKENPNRRHLLVTAGAYTRITSVEVRCDGKLLGASVILSESHDEHLYGDAMHIYGVFSEAWHGADLEVTIQYTVKSVKYKTIRHCRIEVTN